jgi:hypothetical protein
MHYFCSPKGRKIRKQNMPIFFLKLKIKFNNFREAKNLQRRSCGDIEKEGKKKGSHIQYSFFDFPIFHGLFDL